MNGMNRIGVFVLAGSALFCSVMAVDTPEAKTSIISTKHNLSFLGTGEITATSETRICIFCHTPHNGAPQTPLWNKNLESITYDVYGDNSTMRAKPSQPSGPTRLCLSCHDGTLALGNVRRPLDPITKQPIVIEMKKEITSDRRSYIGTSLADDHPVTFSYYDSLPNPELYPTPPTDLLFYSNTMMHCSTCHDAHSNDNKKFLAVDNENSALCLKCHIMDGWSQTTCGTAMSIWNEVEPNPWPRTGKNTDFNWTTVKQNGCENCHSPHSAQGPKRLLTCYDSPESCAPFSEEGNCYPCHNGHVAKKNIKSQFANISRHRVETAQGVHDPKEPAVGITGHVECADCHNPHAVNGDTAAAPNVSGRLKKVSGVLSDGVTPTFPSPADYEYQICFKCHASSGDQVMPYIPRVIANTDKSSQFNTVNPSYHPVVSSGKNSAVPSIITPSTDPEAPANLTTSSIIYCTDCHSDDSVANGGSGSRGPHGSPWAPILRREYITSGWMPDSELNSPYSLCYRCHNQTSILSDVSFQKNTLTGKGGHSLHLGSTVGAPCSVCHDPHGVRDDGLSGNHSHLINFDTRNVAGPSGDATTQPTFTDTGTYSGSCTLICHGRTHTNESYP